MTKAKRYFLVAVAVILPVMALSLYYFFYRPDGAFRGGQCVFLLLTGLQCPGCGGQRSLYYFLHGEFIQALRYNALSVIGIPFFLYLYYMLIRMYVLKSPEYYGKTIFPPFFVYCFLAVLLLFFILRNIPFAPFTYLAPPH